MNILGRLYLLLLTLVVGVALTILLLSPTTVSDLAGKVAELPPVLRVVIAVLADLVLLALVYLQLRVPRRPATAGLMMRASGAETEVSIDSARERILKAVSDVPDVVSVEAQVKPVRGRAEIDLEVEVLGDDVRLPDKQRDINRALKQVINKQLGLQMAGRPRVRIRLYGEKSPVTVPPARVVEPAPAVPLPVVTPPPASERLAPVEPKSVVERAPEPIIEKPAPPIVEPERRESGGLFGGLFRSREPVEDKPVPKAGEDGEMFGDTPELAALLRGTQPAESAPATPPISVAAAADDEEDPADTLVLDLDQELVGAAADELVDAPLNDDQTDDEHPAAANPPPDESRPL